MRPRDLLELTLLAAIWGASLLFVRIAAPAFAMLWGTWLLDEQFTGAMLAGCAAIVLGTSLVPGLWPRAGRR